MNLGEFKHLTKDMPDDLEMMMNIGDGIIGTVCRENSGITEIELLDQEYEDDTFVNDFISELDEIDLSEDTEDEEDIEVVKVFLLVPCSGHHDEPELGEVNSQPKLN